MKCSILYYYYAVILSDVDDSFYTTHTDCGVEKLIFMLHLNDTILSIQCFSSSSKYSAAKHVPISSISNACYTDSTKSLMSAAHSSNNMETDTNQIPYEMLQKNNEEFDNQDDADNNR